MMIYTTKIIQVIFILVFMLLLDGDYVKIVHASNDVRATKDGQVMLASLLPITDSAGNILKDYVVLAEAMIHEINKINKGKDILDNIELGYEIIDNKAENLHLIMAQAIDIVSKHRPLSVCRNDEQFCTQDFPASTVYKARPRISALIGPVSSATTVPVASLLGLYNIPVIGFSASSKLLSDTSRFKSFLRTIPSDNYQAEALASLVRYFDWNYVFFIGNDDEYGRQGLSSFKSAIRKRKVCTASDVNIAFQKDDYETQVHKVVAEIAKQNRVQVVVLFMFENQAASVMEEAKKQNLTNITWIFSDGISGERLLRSLSDKTLADGAIGIDFVAKRIPEFDEHLGNITVKSAKDNPWMTQLLEEKLNCSTTVVSAKHGGRRCGDNEHVNLSLAADSSQWSAIVNIVNSVRAFAYGMKDLLNCKQGFDGEPCPNKTFPMNGKDLYRFIKNASFVGAKNEMVRFDKNGDLDTKEYIIRNYNYDNDSLESKEVALWNSMSPDQPKFTAKVQWKRDGIKPQATCSPECVPGQMKVGQSDCCWVCHPCPKGEISNHTSASNCTKCPENHFANEQQSACVNIELEFVEASDPFAIVIIVISCLGLIAMVIVALLFFKLRTTPLVQDSDKVLLGGFLLSNTLAFIFPIFQVTLYRTDSACRFLSALLLYSLLLVATCLLAKTKTSNNHLRKLVSYFTFLKPVAAYYNTLLLIIFAFLQLLLLGAWFLTDSPVVRMLEQTEATHLRECDAGWSAVSSITYGFPLLILFFATIFAFKERNNRDNHSEAKYVSFCTISMCILLIAFFPTYRFVKGITTSIVIATTSLVGAFAVTGCILLPKIYILVFRPDRNIPGHQRNSEPTVSSAHTAGSHHGSSSTQGPGPQRPKDIELTSSQSSSGSRPAQNTVNKGTNAML